MYPTGPNPGSYPTRRRMLGESEQMPMAPLPAIRKMGDGAIARVQSGAPGGNYVSSDSRFKRSPVNAPNPGSAYQAWRANGTGEEKQYGMSFLRRKKLIKGFTYTTDGTPPFAVAANGAGTASITINKEADFEAYKIVAVTDVPALNILGGRGNDFTYRIKDNRKQMYLSNTFIHNIAGTGSGVFPLIMPEPRFFPGASQISIEFNNLRNTAINIWFSLVGKNYYTRELENLTNVADFTALSSPEKNFMVAQQKMYIEPYMFTLDNGALTLSPSGTATQQAINMRQEADFEIFAYTAYSTAPFSFIIRESNSGRFLMNNPVNSLGGLGDGEHPLLLPEPYWVDSNSQLLIDFTNLSSVESNTIYLTLLGRRWYNSNSLNLTNGPDFFTNKYDSIM